MRNDRYVCADYDMISNKLHICVDCKKNDGAFQYLIIITFFSLLAIQKGSMPELIVIS